MLLKNGWSHDRENRQSSLKNQIPESDLSIYLGTHM